MGEFKPHIGKNVLETLTLGMYENPHFIYREYVQNAADQIDIAVEENILDKKSDGRINIIINKEERNIVVEDNATGIEAENVLSFLGDVANSQKDRKKRKGFRGIGRLGGLGYCENLVFETSYEGENKKSTVTLNALQLKKIIENNAEKSDAATVISVITTLTSTKEDVDAHYFKVELQKVTNDVLLDENEVKDYLSMVAPIPFDINNFPFADKIHKHYEENNVTLEEYDVHLNVNDDILYKPYQTKYDANKSRSGDIVDINFFKIKNPDNELLSIGWYGISNLLNFQISSSFIDRGIRLRKDNIGIGSDTTLGRFFGESRKVLNYIGEVHVFNAQFIPNARRDYFNDNKTLKTFEKELKNFFPKLGTLTEDSSKTHNRKKDIQKYQTEVKELQENIVKNTLTEPLIKQKINSLAIKEKEAISAQKELSKLKKKANEDEDFKMVYENIIGDTDLEIIHAKEISKTKKNISVKKLPKLTNTERKIVLDIFEIIDEELEFEKAELLKKKIAEYYT